MGCNCGKRRGTKRDSSGSDKTQGSTQTFTLVTNDGRTQTFGTRLEAKAAKIRAGGGRIE